MTILQAIVLGVLQGLTEFLPISSSGHLIFVPKLFEWTDQGLSFDVVVHLGSLLAVIVYFRKKILDLLKSVFNAGADQKLNRQLLLLIILSIIPAGLVGLVGGDWIERNLRSANIVAIGLIFWGIILLIADRYNKRQRKELVDINHITWKKMAFIACAQAIALIPGTSRSGITMTAGLFAKLDKKSAAEFSFLMSVPIIFLAGVLKTVELISSGLGNSDITVLLVGFAAAAFSGFVAIWGLMKIIQKWNFLPFVVYRIIIGVLILIIL